MKLSRQIQQPAVHLPFPTEMVTGLKSTFHGVIEQSLNLRRSADVSVDEVWNSSFFSAYIIGYPSYFEIHDEMQMLLVRRSIIGSCFGENWTQILARFKKSMHLIKTRRDGAFEAWRLGDLDGKNYFRPLLNGAAVADNAFSNLRMSVRRLDEFVPF